MVCGMSPAQPAHCALPKPSPPAPPHPTLPQYKLTLSDDLQLEPTINRSTWDSPPAATGAGFIHQPPVPPRIMSRLQSWPAEAAAEAVAAARGAAAGGPPSPLEVGCLAELQYQARVKGFMQPRK